MLEALQAQMDAMTSRPKPQAAPLSSSGESLQPAASHAAEEPASSSGRYAHKFVGGSCETLELASLLHGCLTGALFFTLSFRAPLAKSSSHLQGPLLLWLPFKPMQAQRHAARVVVQWHSSNKGLETCFA